MELQTREEFTNQILPGNINLREVGTNNSLHPWLLEEVSLGLAVFPELQTGSGLITEKHGVQPLITMYMHNMKICGVGNRFLLTRFPI